MKTDRENMSKLFLKSTPILSGCQNIVPGNAVCQPTDVLASWVNWHH